MTAGTVARATVTDRRAGALPPPPRAPRSLTHPPRTGRLLVAPAVAFVSVFALLPLAFAIVISFTNWPLIGTVEWVGLGNYALLFSDAGFARAIGFTVVYTFLVTGPILLLGYLMAVLVRRRRRGVTVLRTVLFLPYVVGLTTLSFMMVLEAQPGSGAINLVLAGLGITDGSTAWLVDGTLATGLISLLVIWAIPGLTMMLLMAGMQAIPAEVYESASLDGAGWLAKELLITVPMLRRAIAMSLIISVIGSFLAFAQFFILTMGGPGSETTTVVHYIYNRAFVQLQLGSATALSIMLVIVVGLITAGQFWLLRERS